MARFVAVILLVMCSFVALAREAVPVAEDPALEAHMMRIAEDMRCLECQNETLAASHAGLAKDLRQQIREMLLQGKTDQEIIDYMVARYGDFVLYRPPFKPVTWLLWLGPFGLLIVGFAAMSGTIRKRVVDNTTPDLTARQKAHAQRLLAASTIPENRQ